MQEIVIMKINLGFREYNQTEAKYSLTERRSEICSKDTDGLVLDSRPINHGRVVVKTTTGAY